MRGDTCFRAAAEPATLHAAAAALAAGEITSVALCERLLARRAAVDAVINGFVQIDADAVLTAARASDARRAAGVPLGRLDGVPIAVKDNLSVAGEPCHCGSRILDGYTAAYDATVVARLKAQGAICFGRTNMDEFAMGSSTEHSAYGPSRNPADTTRVPGGSSGGSAAVVASGQALAALGSDTGGSIRQPASFCGVVGLKPTYGRVSRYGLVAYASSLDQVGSLTTDVRDAALLLDSIGGHDPRDCTSLPEPCGGFEDALAEADLAGLRVGIPREYLDVEGLAPEVRAAVQAAATACEAAGAECVEVTLPHTAHAVAAYYVIATAEASSNLARFDGIRYGHRQAADGADLVDTYFETRANGFGREVKRRIILGTYVLSSGYYDAYYLRAQKVRALIRRDFTEALRSCSLLLGPAAPTPAFEIGGISSPLEMYLSDVYTIPVNLAGICGISVPFAATADGLPIGIQLIAGALDERRLLQHAHALMQQARPRP